MEDGVHILLVEDEYLIGAALQESLEEAGYITEHVFSGHDAMAMLEAPQARVSGLVTDICLGLGPSGWEIATKARQLWSGMPIVYMSGDSAHEHASLGVPNSVMLQKPFATAQLITAISTLLNEQ